MAIPTPDGDDLALYRADLERYREAAELALQRHGAEHPLTRMWTRRAGTVARYIEMREARRADGDT